MRTDYIVNLPRVQYMSFTRKAFLPQTDDNPIFATPKNLSEIIHHSVALVKHLLMRRHEFPNKKERLIDALFEFNNTKNKIKNSTQK